MEDAVVGHLLLQLEKWQGFSLPALSLGLPLQ